MDRGAVIQKLKCVLKSLEDVAFPVPTERGRSNTKQAFTGCEYRSWFSVGRWRFNAVSCAADSVFTVMHHQRSYRLCTLKGVGVNAGKRRCNNNLRFCCSRPEPEPEVA